MNEATVEIGEPKEGLDFLHFARFRPFQDSLDLVRGHGESFRRHDVAQVFDLFDMELTLVETGVKSMFPEAAEYFPDVLLVFGEGVGVNEDVVEIYDHEFVNEVGENVVHKALESGGSIRQTKGRIGLPSLCEIQAIPV